MLWEAIFLLLILKIPLVYLGCVVWWAVRAKPELPPETLEGALVPAPREPDSRPAWNVLHRASRRRGPTPRPHCAPRRSFARAAVPAGWRASGWRPPE